MTKMQDENYKTLIEKGSEIAGSAASTAIGLLVAGPLGAIGGAAFGPIAISIFKKIGTEISERFLGKREEIRIGATIAIAINNIENGIKEGKILRDDNYFKSNINNRSNAETILEGVLLKVRDEYEEKKLQFYSNFLSNLCFEKKISFERSNTLLKIIEQLSYRQILLLAYLHSIKTLDINRWSTAFLYNENFERFHDLYAEVMDLYNHNLIQQNNESGIKMRIEEVKLSSLGNDIFYLMSLNDIVTKDLISISNILNEINFIVKK